MMAEINRDTPRNGAWTDLTMEPAMTGYHPYDLHRLGILLPLHLQPRQLSPIDCSGHLYLISLASSRQNLLVSES